MARKLKIIEEGRKFHHLSFIKYIGSAGYANGKTVSIGLFKCSCGVEKELIVHNVTCGKTKSCGHLLYKCNGRYSKETQRKVIASKVKEGMFDVDEFFKSDFIFKN